MTEPRIIKRDDIFGVFEVQRDRKKKVIFCIPITKGAAWETKDEPPQPHPQCVQSLRNSLPLIVEAGWDEGFTRTIGNPYISGARADMTRQALDVIRSNEDVIIYIDYDLSWDPPDLLKLLETEGDVIAGTYRTKEDGEHYMGAIMTNPVDFTPAVRADGCIRAMAAPAGFLKVTAAAIDKFMIHYPELNFGPSYRLTPDLFHHGAHQRMWWGEDYAFCRNWQEAGGEVWIVPDLNLNHWSGEKVWKGNFHRYLMEQPGGSLDPARQGELEHVNA
jgi:glycosyltransferase involved in cell wall biosynthesis